MIGRVRIEDRDTAVDSDGPVAAGNQEKQPRFRTGLEILVGLKKVVAGAAAEDDANHWIDFGF